MGPIGRMIDVNRADQVFHGKKVEFVPEVVHGGRRKRENPGGWEQSLEFRPAAKGVPELESR